MFVWSRGQINTDPCVVDKAYAGTIHSDPKVCRVVPRPKVVHSLRPQSVSCSAPT